MGWMGRAMVLGDFQCWCIRLWLMVGYGPSVLAVAARGGGGGAWIIFPLLMDHFFFSLSLGDSLKQTEILSQRADKPKSNNQLTHSQLYPPDWKIDQHSLTFIYMYRLSVHTKHRIF